MTANAIAPLRTPEEVAEMLVHISPFTIRRLVARKAISYTPGARKKVLFSEANIQELLNHLNVPAATAPAESDPDDENVFGTTGRSNARSRRAS